MTRLQKTLTIGRWTRLREALDASIGGKVFRGRVLLLLLLLLVSLVSAQEKTRSYNPEDIVVTRWVDPTGSRPLTAGEWRLEHPNEPMETKLVRSTSGRRGEILVLISQTIWNSLPELLDEYLNQLTAEGWGVTATTVTGGTPTSLKELIVTHNPQPASVFMIGNLPVAWFQLLTDWGYEEFPIDLFYMDLNGTWSDQYIHEVVGGNDTLVPGSDGIFDTHTGLVQPEVPVGRLEASTIDWGEEIELVENYFSKNLSYRRGGLRLAQQGLSYVDDDWSYWTTVGLDAVYDDVTVVNDPEITRGTDYGERLLDGYEWIGVMVHSWPGGHSFKYNNGWNWDTFYASDLYYEVDARANFYNLFACSNARYTDANYMAGIYVMAGTWGVGALGSTKTGSMLDFEYFYDALGAGSTMGGAYLQWFQFEANGGFDLWQQQWFYGMSLIGDPTLRPAMPADDEPPLPVSDLSIEISTDSVNLSWSPTMDNLWVDHYTIYRFNEPYRNVTQEDSLAAVTGTGYTDAISTGDTSSYYYLIRARDGAGNLASDSNRVGFEKYLFQEFP